MVFVCAHGCLVEEVLFTAVTLSTRLLGEFFPRASLERKATSQSRMSYWHPRESAACLTWWGKWEHTDTHPFMCSASARARLDQRPAAAGPRSAKEEE